MENYQTTVEVKPVPEFNWEKFDKIEWAGAGYMVAIIGGIYLFGLLCRFAGFFGGLWITWIGILLLSKGFGAMLINPLYCIFAPLVPAVITWVLLVGASELFMAPTRVYRKMTR